MLPTLLPNISISSNCNMVAAHCAPGRQIKTEFRAHINFISPGRQNEFQARREWSGGNGIPPSFELQSAIQIMVYDYCDKEFYF